MSKCTQYQLFDAISQAFQLKNDAKLAAFLSVNPPHICRLRQGRFRISGDIILRIYDKTGWSIEKIRSYLKGPE